MPLVVGAGSGSGTGGGGGGAAAGGRRRGARSGLPWTAEHRCFRRRVFKFKLVKY